MSSLFRALIMGPPGSGKGTISSRIIRDFKLSYISSGDALREQIAKQTSFGIAAKEFIDKGDLVPDELVTNFVLKLLSKYEKQSWLLDGFPRTVRQAEDLDNKFNISLAINLVVPHDIIISRLKGRWLHPATGRIYNTEFNPPKIPGKDDITGEDLVQRDDDKPEVVLARLNSYKRMNSPLVEYYRSKNILKEFFGTETNEIWPRVKMHLQQELDILVKGIQ